MITILHSPEDNDFVDLLTALLHFHHVEVYHFGIDSNSDEGRYKLRQTDYLLIVLSSYLDRANVNIKKLLTAGKATKMVIIPLVLDEKAYTDFCQDMPELKGTDKIIFDRNMLPGLQMLFSKIGVAFLLKRTENEVENPNERQTRDRRKASMLGRRLRMGFWKCYAAATGHDSLERAEELDKAGRRALAAILQKETVKYRFYQREINSNHETPIELNEKKLIDIISRSWNRFGNRSHLSMIEAIADKIYFTYVVKPIDRREEQKTMENNS